MENQGENRALVCGIRPPRPVLGELETLKLPEDGLQPVWRIRWQTSVALMAQLPTAPKLLGVLLMLLAERAEMTIAEGLYAGSALDNIGAFVANLQQAEGITELLAERPAEEWEVLLYKAFGALVAMGYVHESEDEEGYPQSLILTKRGHAAIRCIREKKTGLTILFPKHDKTLLRWTERAAQGHWATFAPKAVVA
jgi:hypothetical protein